MTSQLRLDNASIDPFALSPANLTKIAPDKALAPLLFLMLQELVKLSLDARVALLKPVQHRRVELVAAEHEN